MPILNIEIQLRNHGCPSGELPCLMLCFQHRFQWCMVGKNCAVMTKQVGPEVFCSPHHAKGFHVSYAIPLLMLGECSASIGNWVEKTIVLFLFQDHTQIMTAGIGAQHKPSVKIGVGQDRWGGQELFQPSKCFLAGTLPHVLHIFLDQVVQGLGDFCEIWNESSVIPSDAQELPYGPHTGRNWIVPHSSNFVWIKRNALG